MNARILAIALVSVFACASAFANKPEAHGKKPAAAKTKKPAHGEEHHEEHADGEHHEEKAAH